MYAGRGDAFYLEYTHKDSLGNLEHVLVPLDGGPLKATVKALYTTSPYYKYYLAVGEHIWQERFKDHPNKNKFSPKAIINSHPHDDHLDGLVSLMESQWGEAMEFTGPFIIPNQECRGLKQVKLLVSNLNFQASDGCSVPGIKFYHPSPDSINKEILSYNHLGNVNTGAPLLPAPVQMLKNRSDIKLPAKITVDTSSENLASILMDTDPHATVGEGRMFFTGDNVGNTIWNHVNGKSFSIYKIQHHGSMRNTQISDAFDSVYLGVAEEASLYALLRYAFWEVEDALVQNPPVTVERDTLKTFITTCLKKEEQAAIKEYIEELEVRDDKYMTSCATHTSRELLQLRPLAWEPASEKLKKTRTPTKIWAVIEAAVLEAKPKTKSDLDGKKNARLFYGTPTREGLATKSVIMQPWATSLLNTRHYQDKYKAVLLTGTIVQFFASFRADAYVVSANKTHAHPSAATIAGLALAVHEHHPERPVPLYATDGYAIDIREVRTYVEAMGYEPNRVFDGKHLQIQCLSKGTYMTINGNGGTKAPGPSESRDMLGVTRTLLTGFDTSAAWGEIHKAFEHNSGFLPDRLIDRGVDYRYRLKAPVKTQAWYLGIDLLTSKVTLTATPPAAPFRILNSWTSDAPNFEYFQAYQMYDPVKELMLRIANRHRIDDVVCWEVGFSWGSKAYEKFYLKNNGTFDKIMWEDDIPVGGTAIRFYLEDVTPLAKISA